jgi:hypothetical protein
MKLFTNVGAELRTAAAGIDIAPTHETITQDKSLPELSAIVRSVNDGGTASIEDCETKIPYEIRFTDIENYRAKLNNKPIAAVLHPGLKVKYRMKGHDILVNLL